MAKRLKKLGQILLPRPARRRILRHTRRPAVGKVNFGELRRVKPISRVWGGDRGLPIDRYYLEKFLSTYAHDVQGRVLEVGDNTYTKKFGGQRVTQSDIVHTESDHPNITFVADFANAPHLPSDAFDCVICTQTLQYIPNLTAAVCTLYRILKPGGILLVTVPGISQIYRDKSNRWVDYWRLTTLSARWLFNEVFGATQVSVTAYGNVLAAIAFLHGLAAEELQTRELDHLDPKYELLITIRAAKARTIS
jgi:SAM-dependent methyltransferase